VRGLDSRDCHFRDLAERLVAADCRDFAVYGANNLSDPTREYRDVIDEVLDTDLGGVAHVLVCVTNIAGILLEDLARLLGQDPADVFQERVIERQSRTPED
jgi:hypothetical protein